MDVLGQVTRLPFVLGLWKRFPVGTVENRVMYGVYPYGHYAYGVYWSAFLARQLGLPGITAVEFGVAGGRGLVALEQCAAEIADHLGVAIDVVGFDSGQGMPPPVDYRDLPHIWNAGFYKMDVPRLKARLKNAQLVLGDVATTVAAWRSTQLKLPLGFIAFDLDYYSSTVAALTILEVSQELRLPRVHCYFDDLAGNNLGCMNRYVGEHLAISEFNAAHANRKICPIELLRSNRTRWETWQERMLVCHDFAHPQYTRLVIPDAAEHRDRPL